MIVTPAFDPAAREWFTECGRTSPTLRELQVQLGPEAELDGYYPGGFSGSFQIELPTRIRRVRASDKPVVSRNCKHCGGPLPFSLLRDPRVKFCQERCKRRQYEAVIAKRQPASDIPRDQASVFHRGTVFSLYDAGLSQGEIAARLPGMTKGKVAGLIWRRRHARPEATCAST